MRRLTALLLLSAAAVSAETSVQHLLEDKMFSRLRNYDAALRGALGVATIDLTSGRIFVYNGESVFPTASTIKIPIMLEMFRAAKRGEFRFSDSITLNRSDLVGGSGVLQKDLESGGPKQLTILELVTAMIEHSDNTATNRAIRMARMERVNRSLADLGFRSTRLRRVMMDSAAAARGDENTASPLEMARFVEMLYRGRLADPEQTAQMIGIMKLVKGDIRAVLPAGVETATKTGGVPGVQCEVGIIYLPNRPFVISIFSSFIEDGVRPVGEVTKIVFDYFANIARSNEFGHRVGGTR